MELIAATLSGNVSLLLRQKQEISINMEYFGQIPRLFWDTSTTTATNLRYLLQTGSNSSEKMQIQSNGSWFNGSMENQAVYIYWSYLLLFA